MSALLEIKDLKTRFYTSEGVVKAVNGVSYNIAEGEILAIVGESGSGKSVSMLSVTRLIPEPPGKVEAGEVIYKGRDLLKLSKAEMQQINGPEIAMIFQDPMTSLNPVLTIGFQIKESLIVHQRMSQNQADARAVELLNLVGIPAAKSRLNDYPHQFSGGMRQRAMIAMALSNNPSLLIADEPTTALDVTIQAQIIRLVSRLQEQFGMSVIWITHDLGVVARLTKRVMVMYGGYRIEDSPVKEFYANPRHPYSIGLLNSLPKLNEKPGTKLISIPGQPPDMVYLPPGCPFYERCSFRVSQCEVMMPPVEEVGENHWVACWQLAKTEGVQRG